MTFTQGEKVRLLTQKRGKIDHQKERPTKPSEGVFGQSVRKSFAGWLRQESSSVERERSSGCCEDPGDARLQQKPLEVVKRHY